MAEPMRPPPLLDPGGAVAAPGGAGIHAAGSVPVAEDSSYSSCAKDIICRAVLRIQQNQAKASQKEMTLKYHVRSYSFKVNNQPMSKESTEVQMVSIRNHTP